MALSREKILDTAFHLLNQYGLADLSMRRLATELQVAPGALYYHVKNKQELLASLASRMVGHVYCEGPNPPAALVAGCNELYEQLSPVNESAEVVRLALAFHPEDLAFITRATELFEQLIPDSTTRDSSAPLAATTLLHVCLSLIEEEQTRALLSGSSAPHYAPAPYQQAIRAVMSGWAHTPSLLLK
ncbi:MAG: TetR/AcrR family transcriptional regulator [Rothia sp. (in: high G+C Gram-positive bacteria)]|nr:TetR/AcrR family transcriptional regulator [Rothia sp. (in: high G+C Gram-positive bacteria)]